MKVRWPGCFETNCSLQKHLMWACHSQPSRLLCTSPSTLPASRSMLLGHRSWPPSPPCLPATPRPQHYAPPPRTTANTTTTTTTTNANSSSSIWHGSFAAFLRRERQPFARAPPQSEAGGAGAAWAPEGAWGSTSCWRGLPWSDPASGCSFFFGEPKLHIGASAVD